MHPPLLDIPSVELTAVSGLQSGSAPLCKRLLYSGPMAVRVEAEGWQGVGEGAEEARRVKALGLQEEVIVGRRQIRRVKASQGSKLAGRSYIDKVAGRRRIRQTGTGSQRLQPPESRAHVPP